MGKSLNGKDGTKLNTFYKRMLSWYSVNENESTIDPIPDGIPNSPHSSQTSASFFESLAKIAKSSSVNKLKYRYSRPVFLQLKSDDEINVSADHTIRPIMLPRDTTQLSWESGYAECINAGKSARNEDQASFYAGTLTNIEIDNVECKEKFTIPWTFFGIFDGHAGSATAVSASKTLHSIIEKKLNHIATILIALKFPQEFSLIFESSQKNQQDISNKRVRFSQSKNEHKLIIDKSKESSEFESDTGKNQKTEKQIVIECHSKSTEKNVDDKDKKCDVATPTQTTQNINIGATIKLPIKSNMKPSRNFELEDEEDCDRPKPDYQSLSRELLKQKVSIDELIIGVLESSFKRMDDLIAKDKTNYKMPGGCTANVSLFILGKLYVANAGDSRSVLYINQDVIPMSNDFTPVTDKERIARVAKQFPEFLGHEFTRFEYLKRPSRLDLGTETIFKDPALKGWSIKTVTYEDLRLPLLFGDGKRSRVLATIGVTRGFGDHELKSTFGQLPVKPFLSPEPEVLVHNFDTCRELTTNDVLIMGTDGLWDVTSNEIAGEIVTKSLNTFNAFSDSQYKYFLAAQDLVLHARGQLSGPNDEWKTQSGSQPASLDDISTFIIPIKMYQNEYIKWAEHISNSLRVIVDAINAKKISENKTVEINNGTQTDSSESDTIQGM